jgi:DNA-binding MarR family transcriptional regulator
MAFGDAVAAGRQRGAAPGGAVTTSRLARWLEERGLLDRGPDGVDARAWRVFVTRRGRNVLRRARPLVEGAAARAFARV